MSSAAAAAASGRSSSGGGRSVSRLPPLPATCHAAMCGGRHLATRNKLRPFPGPDCCALLYLFLRLPRSSSSSRGCFFDSLINVAPTCTSVHLKWVLRLKQRPGPHYSLLKGWLGSVVVRASVNRVRACGLGLGRGRVDLCRVAGNTV